MTIDELVLARYSVRDYTETPVTDGQVRELLEVARMAPSACNRQPWEIFVVRLPVGLAKICKAYPRDWFKTAPCVLVLAADHDQSWHRPFDNKDHADIDIAILADHITLKATDMGLGSCMVCHFDKAMVAQALGMKPSLEPVMLIPLGHPNIAPKEKSRKSLEEIVHFW
ncbi:MAG: nitroreductase family protein [Bacteroidales bacterium]|nr:nitroreductase family protein [Bacteroidales bacterium]